MLTSTVQVSGPWKETMGWPPDSISTLFWGLNRATTLILFAPDMMAIPWQRWAAHCHERRRGRRCRGGLGGGVRGGEGEVRGRWTRSPAACSREKRQGLSQSGVQMFLLDDSPKGIIAKWSRGSVWRVRVLVVVSLLRESVVRAVGVGVVQLRCVSRLRVRCA